MEYRLVAAGRGTETDRQRQTGNGACVTVQVGPVSSPIADRQAQKLCFPSEVESSVSRGNSVVSLLAGVEHAVWLRSESGARVDVDWFRLELQQ